MRRRRGTVVQDRERWRVRLFVDGKRKNLGSYETRKEAEDVLANAVEVVKPSRTEPTLVSYGKTWLDDRELGKAHRRVDQERLTWAQHIETAPFALIPLRRVTSKYVRDWVRSLSLKKATTIRYTGTKGNKKIERRPLDRTLARQTIANILGLLRTCLSSAVEDEMIVANPALGVRVPKRPRTDEGWTYLKAAEVERVLTCEAIPEGNRLIFSIAIHTGLRKGELWGLRWSDVVLDGDRPELVVRHSYKGPTKSGKVRRVPLIAPARQAFERWRALHPGIGKALVFRSAVNERDPSAKSDGHSASYSASWAYYAKKAGIKRRVRFHDLRHTCASHLLIGTWGATWRLEEVRDWLGHSTVTVTERYAHLCADSIASKAREIDLTRAALRAAEEKKGNSK